MPAIDLDLVAHRFALGGSVERAVAQKGYLKSDLNFFGGSVPVVRAALKREFFIRKAIGWTLREVSKVRPKPVSDYILRHVSVDSGATFREAVKYLPEPDQSQLRAAYKSR